MGSLFEKHDRFVLKYAGNLKRSGIDMLREDYIGKSVDEFSDDSMIGFSWEEMAGGRVTIVLSGSWYVMTINEDGIITGFERDRDREYSYCNRGPMIWG